MAITQYRIINTAKGILNISADNLYEVQTPNEASTEAVLRGLLTQTGINNPVLTEQVNTLGLSYTLQRGGVGTYDLSFSGNVLADINLLICNTTQGSGFIKVLATYDGKGDTTVYTITTFDNSSSLTPQDAVLLETSIQIYYYGSSGGGEGEGEGEG